MDKVIKTSVISGITSGFVIYCMTSLVNQVISKIDKKKNITTIRIILATIMTLILILIILLL